MSEQDKQLIPIGEQQIVVAKHYYSHIGEPFKWGERMVCLAMETCAHIGLDMAMTRKVILDAETHEEIDLLDTGSHVVHNPHGDQAYTVHSVVDADLTE